MAGHVQHLEFVGERLSSSKADFRWSTLKMADPIERAVHPMNPLRMLFVGRFPLTQREI
jgi:hypothetical protein